MNPRWTLLLTVGCGTETASEPADTVDSSSTLDSTPESTTPTGVADGIDLTGLWSGSCEQTTPVDTGGWPLTSDWAFDLVDTRGSLSGRAGQAWIHGHRTDHQVNFHLAFDASTTGSTNEEYFELAVDDTFQELTGVLASYVTGPTYDCTFVRSR